MIKFKLYEFYHKPAHSDEDFQTTSGNQTASQRINMKIFALISAGGQSDGVDKGLLLWQGKTLIDCVIERIRPQVDHIAISANRNLESYAVRSPHLLPDARQWRYLGGLAALCTAANDLQIASADWLLVVPCDMPNLPDDLVEKFQAVSKKTPLCNAFYIETPVTPHYNVMFIRPQILQSTVPYLNSGLRTVRGWLQQQRARVLQFDHDDCFIRYGKSNNA